MSKTFFILSVIFACYSHAYSTKEGLDGAWTEETKAIRTYSKVIDKFGSKPPFSNIIGAEYVHRNHVVSMANKLGIDLDQQENFIVSDYSSYREACSGAVELEQENVVFYEEALKQETNQDVRRLFEYLKGASKDRHIPAFQRCAREELSL
ncbi:MAG: hypothetical protein RJB66_1909 [Pseudomonadota bacterium]|jgi:rubrerythrin